MNRKSVLAILVLAGLLFSGFIPMSVSATTTNQWTNGGGTGLWSTDANWDQGHKPVATEAVLFSAGSAACSINEDTASLYSFTVNGYTGTITNAANCDVQTTGDITISSGTVTSVTSAIWTCGGSFTKGGSGTVTPSLLNLVMQTTGKTVDSYGRLKSLTINAGVVINWRGYTSSLNVGAGATLSLIGTSVAYLNAGETYTNAGTIGGASTLYFQLYNADQTIIFNTVNCPVLVYGDPGITANRAITLGANTVFGSTLDISSGHASRTMSLLSGASNYQLQVAGVCTVGARAILTQGTGDWTFSGGFTQSGASSVFNQHGDVYSGTATTSAGSLVLDNHIWTCSGNWNTNGVALTPGTSTVQMTGTTKTITTSASQTFYDLMIAGGASITLASSITVTDWLRMDSTLNISTFTVTNTGGVTTCSNNFAFATAGTFVAGTQITCSGNWDSSAFTFTQGSSLVKMDGIGKTLKMAVGQTFSYLTIEGTVTQLSAFSISNDWIVTGDFTGNGAAVNVGRDITTTAGTLAGSTVAVLLNGNNGIDSDDHWLSITINSAGGTITQSATAIETDSFHLTAGTFNQGAALTTGGMTLAGTYKSHGYPIVDSGSWDSSGCTLTLSTSTVTFTGTGTLTTAASQHFWGLTFDSGASVTLANPITVHNRLNITGDALQAMNNINVVAQDAHALGVNGTFDYRIYLTNYSWFYVYCQPGWSHNAYVYSANATMFDYGTGLKVNMTPIGCLAGISLGSINPFAGKGETYGYWRLTRNISGPVIHFDFYGLNASIRYSAFNNGNMIADAFPTSVYPFDAPDDGDLSIELVEMDTGTVPPDPLAMFVFIGIVAIAISVVIVLMFVRMREDGWFMG